MIRVMETMMTAPTPATVRVRARDGRRVPPFLVAMAVALAALAGTAMMIPGLVVDPLLTRNKASEAQAWAERVTGELTAGAATFSAAAVSPADTALLDAVTRTSGILELNLIAADGQVFWASHAEDIGKFHPPSDHDRMISRGQTSVEIDTGRALEAGAQMGKDQGSTVRFMAEVDTPVMLNGTVVGRFEYFTDVTEERGLLIMRLREIIGALVGLGVLFGGVFFIVLMRDNRRRVVAIKERALREQEILSDQLRLGREVRLLGDLNSWLQTSRSLDELFEMSARFLTHLMPDSEGSIYVYSNSRDVLDGCASWNGGSHKAHINPDECWGLRRGRTYVFGEGEVDFTCAHAEPHDGRPYVCIPVLAHGETVGLMHLRARNAESAVRFAEARRLSQMCAEQISLAIANVRMRDQLQDQSIRDPLTGLFNRRYMSRHLSTLLSEGSKPVSFLMLDVDFFKQINDTYGHDVGDEVLKEFANRISANVRGIDLACRFGGEEFVVVMPDTDLSFAYLVAERLRQSVADAPFVLNGETRQLPVTISIGVAASQSGDTPEVLLKRADQALYRAKREGRNRVAADAA